MVVDTDTEIIITPHELEEIQQLDESKYIPEGYHKRGLIFQLVCMLSAFGIGFYLVCYEIEQTILYGFDLQCALESYGFGLLAIGFGVLIGQIAIEERFLRHISFIKGTPIEGKIVGYTATESTTSTKVVVEFIDYEVRKQYSFSTYSKAYERDYAIDSPVIVYRYKGQYYWNIWNLNVDTRGLLIKQLAEKAPRRLLVERNLKLASRKLYDEREEKIKNGIKPDENQITLDEFLANISDTNNMEDN